MDCARRLPLLIVGLIFSVINPIIVDTRAVEAFIPIQTTLMATRKRKNLTVNFETNDVDSNDNSIGNTSVLSHVMLKVPSADKTVEYWMEKGGTIRTSKEKVGSTELQSAFVELGRTQRKDDDDTKGAKCFALELIATDKKNYSVGNVISYIGVSMLLRFQNDLVGLILGNDKPEFQGEEPNNISIQTAASAPGDFLSRFSLKSKDLESTSTFYTSVLGMVAKAQDDEAVCLRYDNDCFPWGIPTTLIFEVTTDDLDMGDCFDHLVISTETSINEINELVQKSGHNVYMEPTDMFGKRVMGVIDPNGYKVVICSN